MGKEFRGVGQNRARLVLDARSGVLLRAKGETRMCTSVLGQTSTNRTRYEQKLLKATAAPALRPAAMAPEPRPRK